VDQEVTGHANSREHEAGTGTGESPETGSRDSVRMSNSICNALVYALAKMYKVDDLQELAKKKFVHSFPSVTSDDLHGVVEVVFKGELEDLKDTVADVCLYQYERLMEGGVLKSVMEEMGALAFRIFDAYKTNSDIKAAIDQSTLRFIRETSGRLNAELTTEKSHREGLQRQVNQGTKNYWEHLQILNNNGRCRRCNADFGATFVLGTTNRR
jgi:hypothetical protein